MSDVPIHQAEIDHYLRVKEASKKWKEHQSQIRCTKAMEAKSRWGKTQCKIAFKIAVVSFAYLLVLAYLKTPNNWVSRFERLRDVIDGIFLPLGVSVAILSSLWTVVTFMLWMEVQL